MARYILGPDALQDLNDIWDYIAADNLEAANRFTDTLFAAVRNFI